MTDNWHLVCRVFRHRLPDGTVVRQVLDPPIVIGRPPETPRPTEVGVFTRRGEPKNPKTP